jgi:transcriptional regulator with PAS, ATPase and Fis domain
MSGGDDTTMRRPVVKRAPRRIATVRVLFTPGAPEPGEPIRFTRLVVGRSPESSLRLAQDSCASRAHAVLHASAGGVQVEDTSANGTWVDGRRIEGTADVTEGAIVRVGDSFLLVRTVAEGTTPEPLVGALFGDAPAMHVVRRSVRLVAKADASVLVVGESGTGKELVARAVHEGSGREGPLVPVNCSAIPEGLAESQLFGHVAGAFTGARGDSPGWFRAAHRGTLFLDELGELPPLLQAKLLRAVEEKTVTPMGSTRAVPCDVRIVAATNRDLRREVAEGRFRGDLYARLAEITVALPPLRERREDVLSLLARAPGHLVPRLAPDLVEALLLHDWPFNVRELLKLGKELEVRGGDGQTLDLELVGDRLAKVEAPVAATPGSQTTAEDLRESGTRTSREPESIPSRDELLVLLRQHGGVISDVARAKGRSRRQVYRWLEEHGIDATEFRSEGDGRPLADLSRSPR